VTTPIRLIAVVVPARDEEGSLGRCLDALDAAITEVRDAEGPHCPEVRMVVVLDRCVDRTAEIVATRTGVETVVSSAGLVGAARSQGVERVLSSVDVPPESVWIANTDADSAVPHDWLRMQLEAARTGCAAILGAVRPDSEGLDPEQLARYLLRHPLRESHRNVHGANLGVRADHYLSVGGFAPVPTGEDVRLVEQLAARGLEVASTGRAAVVTSSRLVGRAPDGYSDVVRAIAG
jgi:hypothetical protein